MGNNNNENKNKKQINKTIMLTSTKSSLRKSILNAIVLPISELSPIEERFVQSVGLFSGSINFLIALYLD